MAVIFEPAYVVGTAGSGRLNDGGDLRGRDVELGLIERCRPALGQ